MQEDPSLCIDIADGQANQGSPLQLKPRSDSRRCRRTTRCTGS
jgi:hypothetical protein